jgi:hypothetical protein
MRSRPPWRTWGAGTSLTVYATGGLTTLSADTVGAALLWTLEQGLSEETFTPEVREAWTSTYALLAGVMKDAAATAPARTGYQPDGPLPSEPRQ